MLSSLKLISNKTEHQAVLNIIAKKNIHPRYQVIRNLIVANSTHSRNIQLKFFQKIHENRNENYEFMNIGRPHGR